MACDPAGGGEDGGEDGGAGQADAAVAADAGPNACTAAGGANPCGSDQYCDLAATPAACVKRCDAATSPTVCENTHACDVDTGMCVTKCTAAGGANPCTTAGEVCGPDGLCEEECDTPTCIALTHICDPLTNACGVPDTVTGSCALATEIGSIPGKDASGPFILWAMADDGTNTEDTSQCASISGTKLVWVTFEYLDNAGADAPSTNGQLWDHFTFWRDNPNSPAAGVDNYSNTAVPGTGSTRSAGTFQVPLCFSTRPNNLVISIQDGAGNNSNKACMVVPPDGN
jgi:hypothetical protein